jgi:hypothetical protein
MDAVRSKKLQKTDLIDRNLSALQQILTVALFQ